MDHGFQQLAVHHIEALRVGAIYVAKYPLGTGLGSSVPRFGDAEGPAESALLAVFGEMGLVGGLLYVLMYGASIVYSFLAYRRVRGDHLSEGLALVPLVGGLALVPIMITSAVWGNFSVTWVWRRPKAPASSSPSDARRPEPLAGRCRR